MEFNPLLRALKAAIGDPRPCRIRCSLSRHHGAAADLLLASVVVVKHVLEDVFHRARFKLIRGLILTHCRSDSLPDMRRFMYQRLHNRAWVPIACVTNLQNAVCALIGHLVRGHKRSAWDGFKRLLPTTPKQFKRPIHLLLVAHKAVPDMIKW